MMFIVSKQTNNKSFFAFTTTTVLFTTYKRAGLCTVWNKNKSLSSIFLERNCHDSRNRNGPTSHGGQWWGRWRNNHSRSRNHRWINHKQWRSKRGQDGCVGINSHHGRGLWGGRVNLPAYTSSIWNFKGEVDYFGAVLGTTSKQRKSKDQYKKLRENMKQYILQ